jgi:hypothetical protein
MKRGGTAGRFWSRHEHDWVLERAAGVLRNEVAGFLVLIAQSTGVAAMVGTAKDRPETGGSVPGRFSWLRRSGGTGARVGGATDEPIKVRPRI